MKRNHPEDLWKFVRVVEQDKCWLWEGGTFSGRYGRFALGGKSLCAHRVAYEIANGAVPNGLFVLHKCNTKLCCNPRHLTVGTNSENQRHAITSRVFKAGASGIPGVGYDKRRKYWRANGYEMGKLRNLYTGPDKEKAIAARKKWEAEYGVTFNN